MINKKLTEIEYRNMFACGSRISRTPRPHAKSLPASSITQSGGSMRKLRSGRYMQTGGKETPAGQPNNGRFIEYQFDEKITPTRENNGAKNFSGEWEEQLIEEVSRENECFVETTGTNAGREINCDEPVSLQKEQMPGKQEITEKPENSSGQLQREVTFVKEQSAVIPINPPQNYCMEQMKQQHFNEKPHVNNDESFKKFEHKELTSKPMDISNLGNKSAKQTPERRLTFELEESINDVEVLKRDSFSLFDKTNTSVLERSATSIHNSKAIKKKKTSNQNRSLRKKVNVLLDHCYSPITTPPSSFEKNVQAKNDSIITISSESSPEITPLASTSRDRNKNKVDLLKHTLTKKYKANLIEVSKSNKSNSIRRKMPDFASLHKKQFEQMEDIATMTKRKEERAKLLLSGNKPAPLRTRNNIEIPIRKDLFPKIATPQKTRKASPPKRVHFTPETESSPQVHMALPKTPIPPLQTRKERRRTREGFTRYGFKKIVPTEKENKNAQAVAVANKSKPTVQNKEKRKELLKCIRTNRRFELLMAMRKGKS